MYVNVIEEGNFVVADLDDTQINNFIDMLAGHGFDVEYDVDWNEVTCSQERVSDLAQLRTDLNMMFDKITSDESFMINVTSVRLEKERREFYGELQTVYCLYSEGEIHSKPAPSSFQEILYKLLEAADNLQLTLEDMETDYNGEEVSNIDDLLFDEEVEEPLTFESLYSFFDGEEEQEEVELDFETVISDASKT